MRCSKIPWIVKTDDDMINNVWKIGGLVEALKEQKEGMNMITCSTKTERVIRQKTGTRIDKWVIPLTTKIQINDLIMFAQFILENMKY